MRQVAILIIQTDNHEDQLKMADVLSGIAADIRKGETKTPPSVHIYISDTGDIPKYEGPGLVHSRHVRVWRPEADQPSEVRDVRAEGGV